MEIYKKTLESDVVDVEVQDYGLLFKLEDGTEIKIEDHHDQDCCESVYADWDQYKWHIEDVKRRTINKIMIIGVKEMGFLVCTYGEMFDTSTKVFIPCYNSQNGYYSDELELNITEGEKTTTVDITKYVEDDIA